MPWRVESAIAIVIAALAVFGGPLCLLMLRSRSSRRSGRAEVNEAIDVAAGWRHMQGC